MLVWAKQNTSVEHGLHVFYSIPLQEDPTESSPQLNNLNDGISHIVSGFSSPPERISILATPHHFKLLSPKDIPRKSYLSRGDLGREAYILTCNFCPVSLLDLQMQSKSCSIK